MKYVIFKKTDDIATTFYPVLIPEHVTHSSVQIKERERMEVHSAGFCYTKTGSSLLKVDKERISESLSIGPKKDDFYILNNIILEVGIYGFQKFKEEENG